MATSNQKFQSLFIQTQNIFEIKMKKNSSKTKLIFIFVL